MRLCSTNHRVKFCASLSDYFLWHTIFGVDKIGDVVFQVMESAVSVLVSVTDSLSLSLVSLHVLYTTLNVQLGFKETESKRHLPVAVFSLRNQQQLVSPPKGWTRRGC
jgi:hypothetical protein